MGTISLRRLSDKTLKKYEELERKGELTPRQEKALLGHRIITRFTEIVRENYVRENVQS